MFEEFWMPVSGYEGIYAVSDLGRVASLARTHPVGKGGLRRRKRAILAQSGSGHAGYKAVTLCKNGKTKTQYVHRLVAIAFLGTPRPGYEVAHANGSRGDNNLINLRWDTRSGNHADKKKHGTHQRGERAGSAKLNARQVKKIRKQVADGESKLSVSKQFSVSHKTIRDIVSKTTWSHVK